MIFFLAVYIQPWGAPDCPVDGQETPGCTLSGLDLQAQNIPGMGLQVFLGYMDMFYTYLKCQIRCLGAFKGWLWPIRVLMEHIFWMKCNLCTLCCIWLNLMLLLNFVCESISITMFNIPYWWALVNVLMIVVQFDLICGK